MALKYQIWQPDTCGCAVEQSHDPDTPGTPVSFVRIIRKCAAHAGVADADLYGVIYDNTDGENKRKNQVFAALYGYEGLPISLVEEGTDPNGSYYIRWRSGINVSWTYTGSGASRVLEVTISGGNLNQNQKNAIANFCDTKFGAGKVTVIYN